MGSSSSRQRPPASHTPFPVTPTPPTSGAQGVSNGQFYGGYALPPAPGPPRPSGYTPQGPAVQPPLQPAYLQPAHYPGQYGQLPLRPMATHEYQQTQTIKNQVNVKKQTLRLVPLAGQPHLLSIQFAFDASAPCRVSTFVLTLEEPKRSCKVTTGAAAPAQPPVYCGKGLNQQFPPPGDDATAAAHALDTRAVRTADLMQQYGDNYPVIIRLEALSEDATAQQHRLEELAPGDSLPLWVQSQTTYAKLVREDDGSWGLAIIKQKIWVKGVSYELQEIYGMEQKVAGPAASSGAGGSATAADADSGRECVICLSNERDTTVLPCRHMCMCQECASALKMQTNKCPICRNEIESLLHIKIQRSVVPPAEGGAAPHAAAA